ncbi:ORF52 [Bovine gammaherpesvirus 6]|uniref:ORF52 n=1 Tax=Bovine gammaherpesvirus 6 TaxID=1504288 RepID=A0A060CU35_9GAMA|nr:ORF52 [Bovine gammaherpesvirus 6]AIB03207.1 ORF52 [Bovine gammaherpesvirus 6]
MAQAGKSGGSKSATMAQLSAQLAQLQMENRELKKKIRKSMGGPEDVEASPSPAVLTPRQKQALVSSILSRLSNQATKKLELKLASITENLQTKEEIEDAVTRTSLRIHVSLGESSSGRLSKEMKLKAQTAAQFKTKPF